ncbi:Aspartic peptidase domain containing protein [Tylopilus felleus]
MNNLKLQGLKEVFSVYIPPITSPTKGRLTYGGIDISLYQGELTYFPLTTTSPASQYWGIDLSSCTYGSNTIIPTPPIAGIVDTGDPKILIPDDLFRVYMNAIPRAKFDTKTGLIEIPPSSIQHMQPLHFTIGDREFTLDVDSQLVPEEMYTAWDADAEKCYGVVDSIGHVMGHGIDFVLGIPFMEKYYTYLTQTSNTLDSLKRMSWYGAILTI